MTMLVHQLDHWSKTSTIPALN